MTFSSEDKILRGPKCKTPLSDNLANHLLQKFRQHGDKVAQEFPEECGLRLTFGELRRRSALAALRLRRLGLRRGDVLAVASAGGPHLTPLLVGALAAGAVVAPLNPRLHCDELRHVLGALRPGLLVADAGDDDSLLARAAPTVLSRGDVDAWFAADAGDAGGDDPQLEPATGDDPALVLCSSGTTGFPKGVQISHRSLLQLMAIGTDKQIMKLGDGAFLLLSPAFWVSAIGLMLLCINAGCRLVRLAQFNEQLFLNVVPQYKVMATMMWPYQGARLSQAGPELDLTPLRVITFAGSSMSRDTQADVQRKLKVATFQAYGTTELLVVLWNDKDRPTPTGSVGRLLPDVEAKVVDTVTGEALGPGQDGELCFRGPTVTRGYYNDPAATAAAFDAEGWFHTGDIGHYDEAEFFYVTDRIKDLIKYKGHHVPSSLLEQTLCRHPAVLDAAVVGVPDLLRVELPRAYVVLTEGSDVSEEELLSFVNKDAPDHAKLWGGIGIVDELPRSATGKIYKRLLKERAVKEMKQ